MPQARFDAARPAGARPAIRVLNPATATASTASGRADERTYAPTLYFADRLLVGGYPRATRDLRLDALSEALAEQNLRYEFTERTQARIEARRVTRDLQPDAHGVEADELWISSVVLLPLDGEQVVPDAWQVLQRLRARAAEDADRDADRDAARDADGADSASESDGHVAERQALSSVIALEHVIRPAGGYWDGVGGYWDGVGGYWDGVGGYWDGVGGYWDGVAAQAMNEYGRPGRGGRMPVSVAMDDPALRARELPRRPVVAIPDTVVGEHPWFPTRVRRAGKAAAATGSAAAGATTETPRLLRMVVQNGNLVDQAPTDPSLVAAVNPETGVRDRLEGHGTFIAGLVRQGCPEATILSVPVMGDDGIAEEGDVLAALDALLERHLAAQQSGSVDGIIDVLSLSMGYYPEDDALADTPIAQRLSLFATAGVIVVAGAGNDASTRSFLPAALAASTPKRATNRSTPPLASVGAHNPNDATVALFSNRLPFVSAYRPGVSLVSTVPILDGADTPTFVLPESPAAADRPASPERSTVDPDDYRGGFAAWSGTSFATPVLAAQLAAELVRQGDLTDVTAAAMTRRAVRALNSCKVGTSS